MALQQRWAAIDSLQRAVRTLFALNHYETEIVSETRNGVSCLRMAMPTNPFQATMRVICVQGPPDSNALTEVDSALGTRDTSDTVLIVADDTPNEALCALAEQARGSAMSYLELFAQFQRFDKYVSEVLGDTDTGRELAHLESLYEEPDFNDSLGTEKATTFLQNWISKDDSRWLIVVGEYGTGKTALTKVLWRRWIEDYRQDPAKPLPIRLELRDFTRQFDARGMMHFFLDRHALGGVSVDFVMSMIREGRIVLILDGYDEMAQYLHARERRACLEALAELSAGGARGILTSRPNYFSEAEELHIFEVLYRDLVRDPLPLSVSTRGILEKERQLDELLTSHFLERYERILRDLSPAQTDALVSRVLRHDPAGRDAVLNVLHRIIRSQEQGIAESLSGKPVIISYLLEVVEGLKAVELESERLSEWQVYKLIIDQLMNRDFQRTPVLFPERRRAFLRELSAVVSQEGTKGIDESKFKALIRREFADEFARLPPGDVEARLEDRFADLRVSATLTRRMVEGVAMWTFSHNSLREYLLVEKLVDDLEHGHLPRHRVAITDPMRIFFSSLDDHRVQRLTRNLAQVWADRDKRRMASELFPLLWTAARSSFSSDPDPGRSTLLELVGGFNCDSCWLDRLEFSSHEAPGSYDGISFRDATLYDVAFKSASLRKADFSGATLEGVDFAGADLTDAVLNETYLYEVNVAGATLRNAKIEALDDESISILATVEDRFTFLRGKLAYSYLASLGARVPDLEPYYRVRFHKNFAILEKVLRKLAEGGWRQRHGLTQRGAAVRDPEFAKQLVEHLIKSRQVEVRAERRNLIQLTAAGREMVTEFLDLHRLPDDITGLFAF